MSRNLQDTPELTTAERLQGGTARALTRLPGPAQRALAGGGSVVRDGLELDHECQLVIALAARSGRPAIEDLPVPEARAETVKRALTTRGPLEPVARREDLELPGPAGPLAARLYGPPREERAGLLVYFHGGGHVIGDLTTCESVCRFLSRHAGVNVLAVDYRLAPEHPFPAAADDATASLRWAAAEAEALGADPGRIAVGGDSAGGNVATVAALDTVNGEGPVPDFQLLIYPVCDYSFKRPSYTEFDQGFMLTKAEMDWFRDHYLPEEQMRSDPRASPLLAQDLSGMPPAYVATAGFDPLRDEGEEYARTMAAAGVPVALRRHDGLVHSFANWTGLGRSSRDAMLEAAGALRLGLAG